MIIYLIGFAGTGKLTVAKEIIKHNKEFTLIDNHKINDLIFNLFDRNENIKKQSRKRSL